MIDNTYAKIDNVTIIVIFLELKKAFDTVDHKILLYKLHMHGIRDTVLDWLCDYLINMVHLLIFRLTMAKYFRCYARISLGSSAIFVIFQ